MALSAHSSPRYIPSGIAYPVGRHPLQTWGGAILCFLFGVLLLVWMLNANWWGGLYSAAGLWLVWGLAFVLLYRRHQLSVQGVLIWRDGCWQWQKQALRQESEPIATPRVLWDGQSIILLRLMLPHANSQLSPVVWVVAAEASLPSAWGAFRRAVYFDA